MAWTELIQLLPKILTSLPAIVAYIVLVVSFLLWLMRLATSRDLREYLKFALKHPKDARELAKAIGVEASEGGSLSDEKKYKLRLFRLGFLIVIALIAVFVLLAMALIQELGKARSNAQALKAMTEKAAKLQDNLDLGRVNQGRFLGDIGALEGRFEILGQDGLNSDEVNRLLTELKILRAKFAESVSTEYLSQSDRDHLQMIDATLAFADNRLAEADGHLSEEMLRRIETTINVQTSREIQANLFAGAVRMQRAKYEPALLCFERVLTRQPHHGVSLSQKARALFLLGRVDEAVSTIASIDAKDHSLFPGLDLVLKTPITGTNEQRAIQGLLKLDQVISQGPAAADFLVLPLLGGLGSNSPCGLKGRPEREQFVRVWLCQTLLSDGRTEQASLLAQKAVEVCADDAGAHFVRAMTAKEINDYELVEFSFAEICRIAPTWESHYNLGLIRAVQKDFPDAKKAYTQALALSPENSQVKLGLGRACFELGEYQDAIGALEWVLARGWDTNAAITLMVAYGRLDEHEKVIREADIILEHEPQCQDALYSRGLSLLRLSRFDEALTNFVTLSKLSPLDARASYHCALACLRANKYELGIKYADQLCLVAPRNPDAFFLRAQLRISLGLYREALKDLDAAILHGRNDAWMEYCRAISLRGLGNIDEARHTCEALLKRSELPGELAKLVKDFQ